MKPRLFEKKEFKKGRILSMKKNHNCYKGVMVWRTLLDRTLKKIHLEKFYTLDGKIDGLYLGNWDSVYFAYKLSINQGFLPIISNEDYGDLYYTPSGRYSVKLEQLKRAFETTIKLREMGLDADLETILTKVIIGG